MLYNSNSFNYNICMFKFRHHQIRMHPGVTAMVLIHCTYPAPLYAADRCYNQLSQIDTGIKMLRICDHLYNRSTMRFSHRHNHHSFLLPKEVISENVCQSLLPMCNNISPMFLYNYIYRDHLMEYISFARLIEAVYLPQIIYTVIALTLSCMSSHRSSTSTELLTAATVQVSSDNQSLNSGNPENTYSDIISSSVHNITVIGVYMVIFAIAGNLMCSYFSGDACTIISTYLEIGSGVPVLYSMDISTKIKTALILSLTAFGGLSALFQSRDMIRISGLSFIKYTTGK